MWSILNQVEARKKKCWSEAAKLIRAAGGPQDRHWRAIKKKWSELKVQAHKYNLQRNATGKSKTFGHI